MLTILIFVNETIGDEFVPQNVCKEHVLFL